MSNCCSTDEHTHKAKFDYILYGSSGIIAGTLALYFAGIDLPYLPVFADTVIEVLGAMWWGIALGIIVVGFMGVIPKEYFNALLGRGDTMGGVLRATAAGLLLDLCNHGILLIGAKLYERGASIAQVMAFLIASPWNSLSLTIILVALIGLKWTLVFVVGSAVIAIITGFVYLQLIKFGVLPDNPNKVDLPQDFSIIDDARQRLKDFKPSTKFFVDVTKNGWGDAKMLLRWLLLGVIIAAAIRAFVPPDIFADWFGPTLFGLFLTLVASTIIEVCSEGSAPIASELLHQANAPGNGFTFLMAGASTDYTEIMIVREATKSWAIALSLPLITVPQIVLIGYLMNIAG